MKISIQAERIDAHFDNWFVLDAEKIQFEDGGDEYTLEEIRTVMRSRRWHHTRKLDRPTDQS